MTTATTASQTAVRPVPRPGGTQGEGIPCVLSVLIVDPSAVVRVFAARLLESAGHRVDVFANGCDAVKATRCARYDLLLIDRRLSPQDMHPPDADRLPVIALSAQPFADADAAPRGFDGLLPKPFTLAEFHQVFRQARNCRSDSQYWAIRPTSGLPSAGTARGISPAGRRRG